MVQQLFESISNGWIRDTTRTAFLTGTPEQVKAYAERHSIAVGSKLKGTIQVIEGLVPVNKDDLTMGIKYPNAAAKEIGLACTAPDSEGNAVPVYRRSIYTDNPNAEDVLVQHTNVDEIRLFVAEQRAKAKAEGNNANTEALRGASPVLQGAATEEVGG